jgi:cell division protein FtsB
MKLFSYIVWILFFVLLGVAIYMILPAYTDYRQTKLSLSEIEKKLAEQQRETAELRREIDDLRKDPAAIERVGREKFGLCRDGEKIYHFDAPAGLGPTSPAAKGGK